MDLLALLSDYTIQNVVIGAALLGLVSGTLGCFAVLRKQSLLGDTLSHAALPGICLGFLVAGTRDIGSMLTGALITGTLAALVMLVLTRHSRLKTDAGLGISLSLSFALGVVLLTYIQGTNNASQGGLDSFLFGQAAATLRSDLWIMGGITLAALVLTMLFWKEFKLVSFDPEFAATRGLPVTTLETGLTVMVSLAVVVGLQMVGVVLMAAMVIAPAVAARQWTHRLGTMVMLSALIGIASGVFGALISATGRGLSTGPLIILSASVLVVISLLFAPGRGFVWSLLRLRSARRHLRGQQVLTTLYRLAMEHKDTTYRAQQGMVDTYYGIGTRLSLARLQRQGLVRLRAQDAFQQPGWELTTDGIAEAQRILDELGQGDQT